MNPRQLPVARPFSLVLLANQRGLGRRGRLRIRFCVKLRGSKCGRDSGPGALNEAPAVDPGVGMLGHDAGMIACPALPSRCRES